MRIESQRELADVAGAGVAIKDAVEGGGVVRCGVFHTAFGEFQAHIVEGMALINARDIEGHMALDALLHGAGKNLAVRDVAVAAAGDGADVFDRKAEVGAGTLEVNLVGAVHEFLECCHAGSHAAVVERADLEVKILERRRAHLRLLGHGGRRPAEDDPLCLVDAPVHDRTHGTGNETHFFIRHIGHFSDVVAAAHGDVGLHFFHAGEFYGAGHLELLCFGSESHFTADAGVVVLHERHSSAGAGGADECDGDVFRCIENVDQHIFAGLELGGMPRQDIGQLVTA